jgi:outer membrane protein assembly factor BamB
MNSYATPTPTVTGDRIVAAFGAGVAVLTTSGDLLWSRTFPEWIANSVYGAASSPVIHGDVVFIGHDREYEGNQPSRLTAYAVSTGEALWTTALEFAHDGYTTPVPSHDGHRTLLLTVTSKMLAAIVASTGELAWAVKTPIATPIPSLIAEDGKLYVTGGKGDQGYTAAFVLRQGEAPIELWRSARNPADVSSPVLYKGRLFTISSTGLMICYDAASGAVLWRQRIGSGLGVFYASLVAADDKVYATRSNGTTYVVGAEDRFRLISENSLPDDMFASPAFSADCLFLRTVTGLYCIRRDATDLVNKPPS